MNPGYRSILDMFDPECILHSEDVKARFEAAGEATERCPGRSWAVDFLLRFASHYP